jgi:hypothetical protein
VAYLGAEEVEKVTKYQNRRFLGIETSVRKLYYGSIMQKAKFLVYLFIYLFIYSFHRHPQR